MTWIVLSILLTIAFWVGIGMWYVGRVKLSAYQQAVEAGRITRHDFNPGRLKPYGLGLAAVAAGIWLAVTLGMSMHLVGQREVAIVYNFSGTIAGKKDPGVVTTMPWQHVKKENVGILHDEWVFGAENSAVSKDQQQIFAILAVNYQVNSQKVVDLYKRVGPQWKTIIIDARVPQVFKEITALNTTTEITAKREKLRIDTRNRLTTELAQYDIDVVDVFVKNLGFSKGYTEAIEAKQQQVQKAQQARAKVQEAKAIADQAIETARGEAQSNLVRARAEARANRLRRQSLTPMLVQLEAIQKLNPNVQTIICPPQSVCIPNAPVIPIPSN
jgi:prohibitin 1